MTRTRIPIPRPRDCTFAESDWNILSACWFPIAVAAELKDAPATARLLDVDLVLFRSHGKVVVARDLCPHRGMLLSRGWVDDGQIICPYHGLHFAGDGRCASIPSRPDARITDRLSLSLLPSVERYGLIWATLAGVDTGVAELVQGQSEFPSGRPPPTEVALGERPPVEAPSGGPPYREISAREIPARESPSRDAPSRALPLPAFDVWDDPDHQCVVCDPMDIAGSSGRQVEGFLDVAHFAWAHTGTFGNRSNPVVPDYTVERREHGLTVNYLSNVSNYSPDQSHRAPADFVWRRHFEVFPPFSARLVIHYPDDKQLWILNAASPVSARRTRLFCPIARNFDQDGSVVALKEFNHRVFNEDRVLVENQRPEDLPLDLGSEISIPADRTSVEYRRLLKQMGLSLVYCG